MGTKHIDTPAPQFKQTWGIERTAQTAVYEAWRTGKPVRFLYRGVMIAATQNKLIGQFVVEFRARGGRDD